MLATALTHCFLGKVLSTSAWMSPDLRPSATRCSTLDVSQGLSSSQIKWLPSTITETKSDVFSLLIIHIFKVFYWRLNIKYLEADNYKCWVVFFLTSLTLIVQKAQLIIEDWSICQLADGCFLSSFLFIILHLSTEFLFSFSSPVKVSFNFSLYPTFIDKSIYTIWLCNFWLG